MSVIDSFNLNGKVALVTGCKRGIGRAMAVALAEAGADIVGVSASLEQSGSEVGQEVTALGRNLMIWRGGIFGNSALPREKYREVSDGRTFTNLRAPFQSRQQRGAAGMVSYNEAIIHCWARPPVPH